MKIFNPGRKALVVARGSLRGAFALKSRYLFLLIGGLCVAMVLPLIDQCFSPGATVCAPLGPILLIAEALGLLLDLEIVPKRVMFWHVFRGLLSLVAPVTVLIGAPLSPFASPALTSFVGYEFASALISVRRGLAKARRVLRLKRFIERLDLGPAETGPCGICWSGLAAPAAIAAVGLARGLPCGHFYHTACLQGLITYQHHISRAHGTETTVLCPTCRAPLAFGRERRVRQPEHHHHHHHHHQPPNAPNAPNVQNPQNHDPPPGPQRVIVRIRAERSNVFPFFRVIVQREVQNFAIVAVPPQN